MSNLNLEIDDSWVGAEGENEGIPFLLRWRPNLQNFIDAGLYTKRLTILWNYESGHDSLMPTSSDLDLMQRVEDALVDILENDAQAILAFVYTGNNEREWHWYTKDISETGQRLNQALADFEELPLNLTVEDDPDWDEYHAVLESGGDDEPEK